MVRNCVLLAFIVLSAAIAAVTASASADPRSETCIPGVRQINGSPGRVFCGPAKATVHVGGQVLRFAPGQCAKSGGMFVVNIGTFLANSHSPLPYFGLLITKPKPGTYTNQTLSFRSAGKSRSSSSATVVMKSLHGGTFTANVFGAGQVTGSFAC